VLKAPLVLLKRTWFDDLRGAPRDGLQYTAKIDLSFAASQVVVPAAAVVVQVDVDRLSFFQERFKVAVDVGVPHIEGKAEVEAARRSRNPGSLKKQISHAPMFSMANLTLTSRWRAARSSSDRSRAAGRCPAPPRPRHAPGE